MYDHTTIPRVTCAQNSSEVHLDRCVHLDPLPEVLQGFVSIFMITHEVTVGRMVVLQRFQQICIQGHPGT